MALKSGRYQTADIFQASLLNIINEASDIGINNLFHTKSSELYRFIICEYIYSLTACHPLRSELQQHTMTINNNDDNNNQQTLSFYENNSIKESKLKNEWICLLNQHNIKNKNKNKNSKSVSPDSDIIDENKEEKEKVNENEVIDYKSIGKNCWIYILQNYLTQKDKICNLVILNNFFNELSSDALVWKELSLTSYEINTNIPYYQFEFELFLSRSCTNLQSLDFECLAKDKISWQIIWQLISKYCLTLKHIHIGLYDGVWKFAFNQLAPIYNDLYRNVKQHSVISVGGDCELICDNYILPITRIECAPGVMPNHIISLLSCARHLQHFFVPLIYNDTDDRWDSKAFWNIPTTLPTSLKSFRGFDAQTPLTFVHECIINLPNIEEFHVVLYFGSAHPDFIACSYTSETLTHLANYCKKLKSFEGYFHSTINILQGIELMIKSCHNLSIIGLLFHPDVTDNDILQLINTIKESIILRPYEPQFQRLTENPNQHVTLRVVEISFHHSYAHAITIIKEDNYNEDCNDNNEMMSLCDMSSQHLKSLDEIDFSDNDDDDDTSEIGLDEKPIKPNNHNNHNVVISDSNDDLDLSSSNMTDNNDK